MNSKEIINRASKFLDSKKYCYWYGGKNQKCTAALLSQLSSLYPSVYTASYIAYCKLDIKAKKTCVDCSGLVCFAYNVPDVGTSQFDKYFTRAYGTPKNGYIVWRTNHCGIYNNGKVIEARGRWSGITNTRPYDPQDWSRLYYQKKVNYNPENNDNLMDEYKQVVNDVIAGKYGNGQDRINKLTYLGYDYKLVQSLVNEKLSKKK